jgi:hypothetical protein
MNSKLKVELNKKPFPHLIIRELFTPEEIVSVRREIDFLRESNLSLSSLTSAKEGGWANGFFIDKAKYDVVYLSQVYQKWENSIISRYVRNLSDQGIFLLFSTIDPSAFHFSHGHDFIEDTKVNFFNHGDKYDSHRDLSDFTSLIYLHDNPKSYTGGNLIFPDFKYSYPCENNSLILFAGYNRHEVTRVVATDPSETSAIQRVSINTFYTRSNRSNPVNK